jgi:MoxR-like ATPase
MSMSNGSPVALLRERLGDALIEREAEIEAILLGLVAGEHVLLVGPPGTAKSHLCRSVAQGIEGCRYVERLMAPTTPPEAVFGPISLSALREDRYEHVGEGSVTDAELVFFDEFFRGSDAIRDTLLHLLGPERQAQVGTQQVQAPLRCAVGAANTWSDSADQQAIMDRWLIRRTVKAVSPQGRETLLFGDLPGVTPACTLQDIEAVSMMAKLLPIPAETKAAMIAILDELAANGIRPSDRRCRQSIKVARAAAAIDGASEVGIGHLECLKDVLWDDPQEQPEKAADIVTRIANPTGAKINALLSDVDQIVRDSGTDNSTRMAALKKLQDCEGEAEKLALVGNGRAGKALQYVKRERVRIQAAVLGMDPDKVALMMGSK